MSLSSLDCNYSFPRGNVRKRLGIEIEYHCNMHLTNGVGIDCNASLMSKQETSNCTSWVSLEGRQQGQGISEIVIHVYSSTFSEQHPTALHFINNKTTHIL